MLREKGSPEVFEENTDKKRGAILREVKTGRQR
jgi:hypothetical protein